MIIQPEWGTRNVNKYFYEGEAGSIAALNEIFGEAELTEDEQLVLIWLAGLDKYTIENMLSAIRKAMATGSKAVEPSYSESKKSVVQALHKYQEKMDNQPKGNNLEHQRTDKER